VTGGFQATAYGKAPIIRELSKYRTTKSFIVWIPAFNNYFVGDRVATGLQLTPIKDDDRISAKKGTPVPARRVFDQLVPLANQIPGDTPS